MAKLSLFLFITNPGATISGEAARTRASLRLSLTWILCLAASLLSNVACSQHRAPIYAEIVDTLSPRARWPLLPGDVHKTIDLEGRENRCQGGLGFSSFDLSTNYIGEIERGEAEPTLTTVFSIADALKVNPSFLLVAAEKPESNQELIERMQELLDVLSKQP